MVETIMTGVSLILVQEQLHRTLMQLDQAGEHVAAAHLLAAIDALEDRLEKAHDVLTGTTAERPLDIITEALVRRYGGQAEIVARDQLALASGDAMITWAHIVKNIGKE